MINSIFNVISELQTLLTPLGINIYKFAKPTREVGNCIILTNINIKKTNVNSINDIIILIYVLKHDSDVDSGLITSICTSISNALTNFSAKKGVIFFNDRSEPETDNVDTNYTVTTYKLRTINS